MNQDQIDSIVRSVCKVAGGILIAHGATQAAAIINAPDVIEAIGGLVMVIIGICASHATHAPNVPTSNVPTSAQPQQPPKQ